MTAVVAALFTSAIEITGKQRFLLMLPLCLSIAVVYKTIRSEKPRDIPPAALILWSTIVAGMCAVGLGLWLLFTIMV